MTLIYTQNSEQQGYREVNEVLNPELQVVYTFPEQKAITSEPGIIFSCFSVNTEM